MPEPVELARRIEEACQFILERKRAHAEQIAWEVGEYLFERFYGGDLDYVERRDPRKTDSLHDIARGTGIERLVLARWMRAYVARKYLVPAGIDADLTVGEFEALRPLVEHLDAGRAVFELRNRHGLTTKELETLAADWKRRLDEGGRLEELAAAPLPASVARRARKRREGGGRRRQLGRADLTIIRLALVVQRWLRNVTLGAGQRASISRTLTRLREMAASGGRGSAAGAADGDGDGVGVGLGVGGGDGDGDGVGVGVGGGADAGKVVDEAVRFIQERVRRHGMQFALEVGRYLFEHVYGGDRAAFRVGGARWQADTIRRIASDPRVELDVNFLYRAIHVFLLSTEMTKALPEGEVPQLPMYSWSALWPLGEEPETLVPVAKWAAAERVPVGTLADVVALVAPYLAQGGSLDDLLAGSRRRSLDTPYRRIERLLAVLESLLAKGPLEPGSRPRAVSALDECLAVLG